MRKNVGKLPKHVEKKMLATVPKMLAKNIGNTFQKKILMRKNVGKLTKNVDEKKCCQHFQKTLTKNVGYTLKNVDEKMFTRVKKMLTKKCSQHYRKILMKEY
jgi:hypothetical protein